MKNGTVGDLIRSVRQKLGMTQEEFALWYGISLSTVRNWEQERCDPDALSVLFLRLLEKEPNTMMKLLRRHCLL
jgi:DNA-binding transcriptional regulator YiaG